MSIKQSAAKKKWWAKQPKAKKSAAMSSIATQRMAKLSPLQRKRIARKLVRAREEKRAKGV